MKKVLFIVMLALIFPGIVLADNISLVCPGEVDPNSDYSCTLAGYTDGGVFSLSAKVIVSGNVQMVGFITNRDSWQGDGANGDVQLYREDNMVGSFPIGTIKLKSTDTSDNVMTIENITFFNADGSDISINPISRIVKVKKPR